MKYVDADYLKRYVNNAENLSNAVNWSKEKTDNAKRFGALYHAICKMMTEIDINHEDVYITPDDASFSIVIPKLYFVNLVKYCYSKSDDKFFIDSILTEDEEFKAILRREILSVINENLDLIFENVKDAIFSRIELMSSTKLRNMEKEIDALKDIKSKTKLNK